MNNHLERRLSVKRQFFYYFKDKDTKEDKVSVGLFELDNGEMVRTMTLLSQKEQPCRKVARSILIDRATRFKTIFLRDHFENTFIHSLTPFPSKRQLENGKNMPTPVKINPIPKLTKFEKQLISKVQN